MVNEKWFVALASATDEQSWLAALGDAPAAALDGLLRRVDLTSFELLSQRIAAVRGALASGALTLDALATWRDDLREVLVALDGLGDFHQKDAILKKYGGTRNLPGTDDEAIKASIRDALWRGDLALQDWVEYLDGYRDLVDRDVFLYRLPGLPQVQAWRDRDAVPAVLAAHGLEDVLQVPRFVWRTPTPELVRIEVDSDHVRWTWVSWRQRTRDDHTVEERRCLSYAYLRPNGDLELQLPHHKHGGMRALLDAREAHEQALTPLLGVAPTLVHLEPAMRALMSDRRMTLTAWRVRTSRAAGPDGSSAGGILEGKNEADLFAKVRTGLEEYYALHLAGEWAVAENRALSIRLDARTDAVTVKEQCAPSATADLLAALREQSPAEGAPATPARSAAQAHARRLVDKYVTYQRRLGQHDIPVDRLASREAADDLLLTAATLREALDEVEVGSADAYFFILCPTTRRPVYSGGRELRFDRLSEIPTEVRCENEPGTPQFHSTGGSVWLHIRERIRPRKHAVLLVHGIRTQAEHQQRVAATLETEPTIVVRPTRYGFFDVVRFLIPIPWLRRRPVERITRLVRDELSKRPDRLSIVAHSFGTFVVTKILQNEPDLRLYRLLLCGSIVPDDFPWEQHGHKLPRAVDWQVVNDCGMRDPWPVLAQSVTWGYGSSGRFGFGHVSVKDRFHAVGHSGFFSEEFVRTYWLPYLADGRIVEGTLDRPTTPWLLSILTVLRLRYLMIAAGLLAIYLLAF